jgi:hypothetical protein
MSTIIREPYPEWPCGPITCSTKWLTGPTSDQPFNRSINTSSRDPIVTPVGLAPPCASTPPSLSISQSSNLLAWNAGSAIWTAKPTPSLHSRRMKHSSILSSDPHSQKKPISFFAPILATSQSTTTLPRTTSTSSAWNLSHKAQWSLSFWPGSFNQLKDDLLHQRIKVSTIFDPEGTDRNHQDRWSLPGRPP